MRGPPAFAWTRLLGRAARVGLAPALVLAAAGPAWGAGSTLTYRSIGLGAGASGRVAVRCPVDAAAAAGRSYAAVVRAAAVVRSRPGPGRIVGRFSRVDLDGFPTVFGVLEARVDWTCAATWYRVQLPLMPNGTAGWVRASAVRVYRVTSRVVIDLSARRLVAYRAGRLVLAVRVAVGSAATPTPVGRFFVNERFALLDPSGPLGAAALGLSAHSNVLHDWPQGGPIALHGTNEPWAIGAAVSNGCVRLANAGIRRLAALVPAGTPVVIRR